MIDSTKAFYSIKEMEEIIQVTQSTLRFWEKEFALKIQRRNKQRKYTSKDRNILLLIKKYKDRGIKNKAIKLRLTDANKKDKLQLQVKLIQLREDLQRIKAALQKK